MARQTPEQFGVRQDATFDNAFIGAHAISQVVLINSHPTGQMTAGKRIECVDFAGWHSELRQGSELPGRVPQRNSLDDLMGTGGTRGDDPCHKEFLRPIERLCDGSRIHVRFTRLCSEVICSQNIRCYD